MSPFVSPLPLEDILDPLAPLVTGRQMAERGGDALWAAVRERTPISHPEVPDPKRRPGTARESVVRDRVRGLRGPMSGWVVRVFSLDPVFPHIEWDTKPHLIVPRPPRQALRFMVGGQTIFARVVHHPGTKGQHPMARGSLFIEVTAAALLQPLLDEFARTLVTV